MKCAVITPVGPGHKDDYARCLDSVKAAWEYNRGKFDSLEILPMWDLEGKFGRSARRNSGIKQARKKRCEWLFFLDADDLMHRLAFQEAAKFVDMYDAIWGNICEAPYDNIGAMTLRQGQLPHTEKIDDILKFDPALTLQMGHFVRTDCADQIRFDTSMNTGEDFKYYLALWEKFRCAKVPAVFFLNRRGHHSTGPRSANGVQWRTAVENEIREVVGRRGLIADVTLEQKTARFAITNPFDIIQAHLCHGVFFEQNELLALKSIAGAGKVIVEAGANVGNHLVFYAVHMGAKKIYPFEPDPKNAAILRNNIALNGLDEVVDARGIGLGLGRQPGRFSITRPKENNLGPTRLVEGDEIEVLPLDHVMAGIKVDFIRIDVGGMEFEVLEGARRTIAEGRPMIYVQVWNDRVPRFEQWVSANGYKAIGTARLVNAVNFLVGPA
jgi:FkbM family methyltransferase